jgi:hypothetical protein
MKTNGWSGDRRGRKKHNKQETLASRARNKPYEERCRIYGVDRDNIIARECLAQRRERERDTDIYENDIFMGWRI